jgi:hypothetical protein
MTTIHRAVPHTRGHVDCPVCEAAREAIACQATELFRREAQPPTGLGETEDEYYSRIWQKMRKKKRD